MKNPKHKQLGFFPTGSFALGEEMGNRDSPTVLVAEGFVA